MRFLKYGFIQLAFIFIGKTSFLKCNLMLQNFFLSYE